MWIVIIAALRWIRPTAGTFGVVLTVVGTGGLLLWAADEIVRGVNFWRRCLGAAVAVYELAAIVM